MASLRSIMLRAAAMAALVAGAAQAAAFGLSLESSKIALSKGALELGIVVSPAQPELKELTIETLIDTTGKAVLSNLVRNSSTCVCKGGTLLAVAWRDVMFTCSL